MKRHRRIGRVRKMWEPHWGLWKAEPLGRESWKATIGDTVCRQIEEDMKSLWRKTLKELP